MADADCGNELMDTQVDVLAFQIVRTIWENLHARAQARMQNMSKRIDLYLCGREMQSQGESPGLVLE